MSFSFNRTFMELKLITMFKLKTANVSFNRTFMELKLHILHLFSPSTLCFNRTFMELKLITMFKLKTANVVLIVPLWN